jgi:response regulator NasT
MNMPPPHDTLALAGLRVLLVDDGRRRSPVIRAELMRLRCRLVDVLDLVDQPNQLLALVDRHTPDLVLIDSESPAPALLQQIAAAQAAVPRPLALLAEDAGGELMRAALQAGVSVVVVAGLQPQRLGAVLMLTRTRFEQDQALRNELARTRALLAERKHVERAKGILMREQGLDEDAAYQKMRRMAMDRGETLGVVAERLIEADNLLRPK